MLFSHAYYSRKRCNRFLSLISFIIEYSLVKFQFFLASKDAKNCIITDTCISQYIRTLRTLLVYWHISILLFSTSVQYSNELGIDHLKVPRYRKNRLIIKQEHPYLEHDSLYLSTLSIFLICFRGRASEEIARFWVSFDIHYWCPNSEGERSTQTNGTYDIAQRRDGKTQCVKAFLECCFLIRRSWTLMVQSYYL